MSKPCQACKFGEAIESLLAMKLLKLSSVFLATGFGFVSANGEGSESPSQLWT